MPDDVRAVFVAVRDENWARSYIDTSGWVEAERIIVPQGDTAGRAIRSDGREALRALAHAGTPVRVLEASS